MGPVLMKYESNEMIETSEKRSVGHRTVEYEGFVPCNLKGTVTKSAPHKALKSIAWGKLAFDERVVLHRVNWCLQKHQYSS